MHAARRTPASRRPRRAAALTALRTFLSLAIGIWFTLLLSACGDRDPAAVGAPPARLELVTGEGQRAAPGDRLPEHLVARIFDAEGNPVQGARVFWTATAGRIAPASGRADVDGRVSAEWELGPAVGEQVAEARVDGLPPLRFTATADPGLVAVEIPLRAVPLVTYEGSGQVVHPDVARLSGEWGGGGWRMAITPYPYGDAQHENPSLFASDDGTRWSIPSGTVNPLVRPTAGHLSDPDIVWVAESKELWLYYRGVAGGRNQVWLTRSGDGVTWTQPRLVVDVASHLALSPSVERRGPGTWLMWTVDGGFAGCGAERASLQLRRSTDGVTWSAPEAVTLDQRGAFPWHVEVQWIAERREYWAMYNAKVAGSCTTTALYLATSADGVTWRTYPSPVLARGTLPELRDIVYRATFAYDASRDAVTIWHSGARSTARGYEWRAATERRSRRALFDAIARTDLDADPLVPDPDIPPLTNGSAP